RLALYRGALRSATRGGRGIRRRSLVRNLASTARGRRAYPTASRRSGAVSRTLLRNDRLGSLHTRRLHLDVPAEHRVARACRARQGCTPPTDDRIWRCELGGPDGRRPPAALSVRRSRLLGGGRRLVPGDPRGPTV